MIHEYHAREDWMGKEGLGAPSSGRWVAEGPRTPDEPAAAAKVEWARRIQDVTVPQDPWKCAACGGPVKYRATRGDRRDGLCARCYRVLLRATGLGALQSYRREWTPEVVRRLGRRHRVHETRDCQSCRLLARGHNEYGWLVTRCGACRHLLYGQSGHDCVAHHAVVYRAFLEESRRA